LGIDTIGGTGCDRPLQVLEDSSSPAIHRRQLDWPLLQTKQRQRVHTTNGSVDNWMPGVVVIGTKTPSVGFERVSQRLSRFFQGIRTGAMMIHTYPKCFEKHENAHHTLRAILLVFSALRVAAKETLTGSRLRATWPRPNRILAGTRLQSCFQHDSNISQPGYRC
jgi:hypothetical protein